MKKKIFGVILTIIVLFVLADIWISYNHLTITHFTVSEDAIPAPFRMVLVSDLHDHRFGPDNQRLVAKIREQQPDLIILDGDIMNEYSEDSSVVTELIRNLKPIAPVYMSLGNHEVGFMKEGHPELISELEDAGAVVLHETIADITVNGNDLRLGGIYSYGFETGMQSDEENARAVPYMEKFIDTDRYLIMCSHRPESFYCWDISDRWGLDLQLSGHLHGGQVIVPFKGGLYAPLEGFFPRYDYGRFEVGDCTMIITRGLGSSREILPRFNNPPEIVVVDVE